MLSPFLVLVIFIAPTIDAVLTIVTCATITIMIVTITTTTYTQISSPKYKEIDVALIANIRSSIFLQLIRELATYYQN